MVDESAQDKSGTEHPYYEGAGDGQCVAIKVSDGRRCTNGVYGRDHLCGTHKNASDPTLAPNHDDEDWIWCDSCGWQPVVLGADDEPHCTACGCEPGVEIEYFSEVVGTGEIATDGGVQENAEGEHCPDCGELITEKDPLLGLWMCDDCEIGFNDNGSVIAS